MAAAAGVALAVGGGLVGVAEGAVSGVSVGPVVVGAATLGALIGMVVEVDALVAAVSTAAEGVVVGALLVAVASGFTLSDWPQLARARSSPPVIRPITTRLIISLPRRQARLHGAIADGFVTRVAIPSLSLITPNMGKKFHATCAD